MIRQFSAILPRPRPLVFPELCVSVFCARRRSFFLTLPDSSLLVKHAYISDGFKPTAGRRSAGRKFLHYVRATVKPCIPTLPDEYLSANTTLPRFFSFFLFLSCRGFFFQNIPLRKHAPTDSTRPRSTLSFIRLKRRKFEQIAKLK